MIKKIIFRLWLVSLVLISVFSCNKEEQKNQEFSHVSELLEEMKSEATSQKKTLEFNVFYKNGVYTYELIGEVKDNFVHNFVATYSASNSIPVSEVGVVVITCSDGEVTVCDENDGKCVGVAVKRCLNKGECVDRICGVKFEVSPD